MSIDVLDKVLFSHSVSWWSSVSGLGQGLIAGTLPLSVVLPELAGPSSIPSLPCPALSFGMVQGTRY